MNKDLRIAVIGLGYVGLPLAVEFSHKREILGFDINEARISELKNGVDSTLEVNNSTLHDLDSLTFTSNPEELASCNCFIITVPTPVDKYKRPNLLPLLDASKLVGERLNKNSIVIFESTVYPGCTEEECVPVLEKYSSLKYNTEFFCGYSPERINPGDKDHRLKDIKKVTSGSTPKIAKLVDELYSEIITAGTHMAKSIKVAEAAKVIENTQRDLNIALINELAIIFGKMEIDTQAVLEAAGSKWNFLPFRPGLVGGHCIGVDPYYLTHKAQAVGHNPEVILAGRKVNDGMGEYVASQLVKAMIKSKILIDEARVLIMGLSFKENCPDLRNTKVVNVIGELSQYNCNIEVYDPVVDSSVAQEEYGISLTEKPSLEAYDAIIIAVAHDVFQELGIETIKKWQKKNSLIYDLKYVLSPDDVDIRL